MAAVQPTRAAAFPLGALVTLAELDADPHRVHHRLRAREPVSWLPALDGWLVTSHALAIQAMRDAGTFTVDDSRFTTAQVVGPSMLSLDGAAHDRHRAPFTGPFRAGPVRERFAADVARRVDRLLAPLRRDGRAELRRELAGPLAAATIARALGLPEDPAAIRDLLADYAAIVDSVTALSAGTPATAPGLRAADRLHTRLAAVADEPDGASLLAAAARNAGLDVTADAAILLFGGIETTDGMIANAARQLLARPATWRRLAERATDPEDTLDPHLDAAIDESLRREPAAAVLDRYATRPVTLGGAEIAAGELVRISLAAANRDPAVFPEPDRFDPARPNLRRHLAFAQGPHVCVGVHLARLEARAALRELLTVPGLRLDPDRPPPPASGLVFRKPPRLDVICETPD